MEKPMRYKELVLKELKETKLKNLWQEIYKAYEQGGIEQVKIELDSLLYQKKKEYKHLLQMLEKYI